MRKLRTLTDRLIGRLVPEVTAAAIWVYEYRCVPGCTNVQTQRRRCHDSGGGCDPWVRVLCDC